MFTTPPTDVTVACDAIPAIPTVDYTNSASGSCLIAGTVTATRTGTVTGCGGTLTDSWTFRSEERRVGKECRTMSVTSDKIKKMTDQGKIKITCGATPTY